MKFYYKAARLSRWCFEKLLELDAKIGDANTRRGNAAKCTQGTVKDILFNLTEDVQFKFLCEMAAGTLTATDIQKQLVMF